MRALPVLLQPRVLSLKNRWFRSGRRGLKELAALSFSALMMAGIYLSTLSALKDLSRISPKVSLDPAIPFSVMLAALFVIIYLSSSVSGLSSLFMSRDLDLTLSAPISRRDALNSKTIDVGISVSWMVCIFSFPALFAFGSFYHADPLFMVGAPLLCIAFLSLAVCLGLMTSIIFAACLPSERATPVFMTLFLLTLGGFFAMLNGASEVAPLITQQSGSMLVAMNSFALNPWLPSTHCARALIELLRHEYLIPILAFLECLGAFSLLMLLLQLVHARWYEEGLSRTRRGRGLFSINSRMSHRLSRLAFTLSSPASRAIITKEYKVFSRDLTHTVQLGLLIAITFVYLYNYQYLRGPSNLSPEALALVNIFLLLSNIALGSLVITSICSRFVFPSVSLEGHAFWLLQSSPVSPREVLVAKWKGWRAPISCIGAVIFSSGAMALDATPALVGASCVAGIIVCHGLVGLGVGLGALFSEFEWEHATQLSTSIGSFVFMLMSMAFLACIMVPLATMFGTYLLLPNFINTDQRGLLVLGGGLLCTYLVTTITTRWALSAGARALQPK